MYKVAFLGVNMKDITTKGFTI